MIIAVDFDGVLTPNGHWPEVGEPNTKLFEWLKFYRELGGKLILWTNRTGAALENFRGFFSIADNRPFITFHNDKILFLTLIKIHSTTFP